MACWAPPSHIPIYKPGWGPGTYIFLISPFGVPFVAPGSALRRKADGKHVLPKPGLECGSPGQLKRAGFKELPQQRFEVSRPEGT